MAKPDYNQLFEAYRRGDSPGDDVTLHYLSQIPDLTRSEFIKLADEIESIAGQYMGVATGSAPLSHLSDLSPAIEQATASKPFAPTRTATGKPIDIDPDDYQKTAETLRGLPENEVKHDVDLHTIWKLANEGRLAGDSETKPTKDKANELYDAYRGGKQSLNGQFGGLMAVAGQFKNPLSEDGFAELKEQLEAINVQHATNIAAGTNQKQSAIDAIVTKLATTEAERPKVEKPFDLRTENLSPQSELGKPKPVMPEPFSITIPVAPTDFPQGDLGKPSDYPKDDPRSLDLGDMRDVAFPDVVAPPIQQPTAPPVQIPVAPPIQQPRQPIQTTSDEILQPSNSEGIQAPSPQPTSWGTKALDWIQRGADALGVVDQSGLTDMANATLSFARAAGSQDDSQQREHLINAGVSMVSAIPIVGDAAKVWKYNRVAKQSIVDGGGVNAAGQPVPVAPPLQTGGSGGMMPPIVPPVAPPGAPPPPGGNPPGGMPPIGNTPGNNSVGRAAGIAAIAGFVGRMFGGGNTPQTQTGGAGGGMPPVVPPGNNGGGGFFGNNISQLFGGNAAQGGSGYFANGGGFFGGGGGSNSPGSAAATQVANRSVNAINTGVQGIAMGAAAAGIAIPGLQPFAVALAVGVQALEAFNAGIEAVDRTNQAIIEGNRDLGQYNGGLAGAYVNYDARTFQRDVERSKDMEAVLPDLMERQSTFADAQQDLYGPYAQAGVVIQSQVTSAATTLVKILDWLEPFGEMIEQQVNASRPSVDPKKARNAFEQAVNDYIFGPKNPNIGKPPALPGVPQNPPFANNAFPTGP